MAASPVNVIDSIVMTEELDTSQVLAKWSEFDPSITAYKNLTAAQSVILTIKWSDKNGSIDLHLNDYFTFVIPDIFMQEQVNRVTDAAIMNSNRDIVATYSIYVDENDNTIKELKVTFTDYVETHSNISGDLWLLLFVGEVDTTEHKDLEFIINGNIEASGEVIIDPHNPYVRKPHDEKNGYSSPTKIVNGYYIFEWIIYINMTENTTNGFNTLENFSFEDIIPPNSPHVFLTNEIRQELGLAGNAYVNQIGEYTGADPYPPLNRYSVFKNQYNSTGTGIWYTKIVWNTMTNGLTTVGIDGNEGLNVSNIKVTDKLFSADLGTLTRPTAIRIFTVSTVKITESALGDTEVVKLYKNMFKGSSGQDLSSPLILYRFESGGSAQGIIGDYNFMFTKVDEGGSVLPGALFSLYTIEHFEEGTADRFVYSGEDGIVAFEKLPEGTFYVLETVTPYGYIPNKTIYKVVLNSQGFEIYYGDNFENKLSDYGNKLVNKSEVVVRPISVTLTGTKNLIGRTLSGGMFRFVVKDYKGETVATGTNDINGFISLSQIEFNSPGIYDFTVEEVRGTYSGITYDSSKFTVKVTITNDGKGNLEAEITYQDGGIVFNNGYSVTPVKHCKCYERTTKCRRSIEGQKIWVNDTPDSRPPYVQIILLRDDEVYEGVNVDSAGDGAFAFCCLPVWKNSSYKYRYKIDEYPVPEGYTKKVEGYNVINTRNP